MYARQYFVFEKSVFMFEDRCMMTMYWNTCLRLKKKKSVNAEEVPGEGNNKIDGITWIRTWETSFCSLGLSRAMTQWLAEAPVAGLRVLAPFLMERATLLGHQEQKERDGFSCCLAEPFIWISGSSLLRNTSVGKSDIRTQQGVIYHFRDKPRSRLRFGARRQGQSWPVTIHWDEYNQGSASSFPCKKPLKLPLKGPAIPSLSRLPKGNKRAILWKDGWGQGGPGFARSY